MSDPNPEPSENPKVDPISYKSNDMEEKVKNFNHVMGLSDEPVKLTNDILNDYNQWKSLEALIPSPDAVFKTLIASHALSLVNGRSKSLMGLYPNMMICIVRDFPDPIVNRFRHAFPEKILLPEGSSEFFIKKFDESPIHELLLDIDLLVSSEGKTYRKAIQNTLSGLYEDSLLGAGYISKPEYKIHDPFLQILAWGRPENIAKMEPSFRKKFLFIRAELDHRKLDDDPMRGVREFADMIKKYDKLTRPKEVKLTSTTETNKVWESFEEKHLGNDAGNILIKLTIQRELGDRPIEPATMERWIPVVEQSIAIEASVRSGRGRPKVWDNAIEHVFGKLLDAKKPMSINDIRIAGSFKTREEVEEAVDDLVKQGRVERTDNIVTLVVQ